MISTILRTRLLRASKRRPAFIIEEALTRDRPPPLQMRAQFRIGGSDSLSILQYLSLATPTAGVSKPVCGHCPVFDACLSYALQSGQDAGIWGGLTEEERRIIKRRTVRPRRAG